jgi:hypothetical protein
MAVPVDVSKFDLSKNITVVTRVARVWATVMQPGGKAWTADAGIAVKAWPAKKQVG